MIDPKYSGIIEEIESDDSSKLKGSIIPEDSKKGDIKIETFEDVGGGFVRVGAETVGNGASKGQVKSPQKQKRARKKSMLKTDTPSNAVRKVSFSGAFGSISVPYDEVIETESAVVMVKTDSDMEYFPPDDVNGFSLKFENKEWDAWNIGISFKFAGSSFLVLPAERKNIND